MSQRSSAVVRVLATLLLFPVVNPGRAAQSTDHGSTVAHAAPAAESTSDTNTKRPKVTIEAAREQALRRKVDQFVNSVVVQPWDDALYRWTQPICPLVAGLPKSWGEFILARISKAAIDAHAPLAGRVCRPNLYVIATVNPDQLPKTGGRTIE